jgi:hypothetical protein
MKTSKKKEFIKNRGRSVHGCDRRQCSCSQLKELSKIDSGVQLQSKN